MKMKLDAVGFDPFDVSEPRVAQERSAPTTERVLDRWAMRALRSMVSYRKGFDYEKGVDALELKLLDEIAPDDFSVATGVPAHLVPAVIETMVSRGWLSPARAAVGQYSMLGKMGVCAILNLIDGKWYEGYPPRPTRSTRARQVARHRNYCLPKAVWAAQTAEFKRKARVREWSGTVHDVTVPRDEVRRLVPPPPEPRKGPPVKDKPCSICGSPVRLNWKRHPRHLCRAATVRRILES